MPPATRTGHESRNPADSHGAKCCPHSVIGPAVSGSPNVFLEGLPMLRVGDPGVHSACCASNSWQCAAGSTDVFVNGIPAVRRGDATRHCGGAGAMVNGSTTVFLNG